ncbi:PREDICTED: uncharacterized protein LOC105558681 isoform X2 [Vollenhovia emeryi]|uniref:uncharacterized protein LOC105558681 isoform X2 n=1 Tax=Vollenhovia emeryi TaxID=411798 RepID=UPI0005F4936A|nr:PREDICTED: uncharacterized protein LOC105558681 isoform X2 [Vollenhovia emeryi]
MADGGNQAPSLFDKMENFPPLVAGNNVSRNWYTWKQKFLSFLQKEDAKESYKKQWTVILLMLIGPLGEEAYNTLSQTAQRSKDLKIVLRELDIYFIFGIRKRQNGESIDKYVDRLMLLAIASNHNDPVSIVKEKIIEDIKNYNFTGRAALLVRSKGDSLVLYLQSLDFNQITLFWKQCEELMMRENRENVQGRPFNSPSAEMECARCGTRHNRNRCPAHGLQCDNCKGFNHFTDNCKVKYVSNCSKCGTHHVQSRCLAFGKLCTKCGKVNHFSWLCQVPTVKDCLRCGGDHAISMCPAQGRVCSRCKKPNHFEEKCLTKIEDEQEKRPVQACLRLNKQ